MSLVFPTNDLKLYLKFGMYLKTRHFKGEGKDGDMKSPLQIQDAGLPDTNRRDPHKPGENPALQGRGQR